MKEIPLTKGYVALIDDDDYERVSVYKWHAAEHRRGGKLYVYAMRKGRPNVIGLHTFIMAAEKGILVDHKDHDGLNCQKANMRLATVSQNGANRHQNKPLSGYKGVYVCKRGYITARIHFHGTSIHLGYFKTLDDAAKAYDVAGLEKFGEFASLNFPHEQRDPL